MYLTLRSARLHGSRILDGTLLVQKLVSHINDNYEAQMRAAINVFGDPNRIVTSSLWADLEKYQEFSEQLMADPMYADFLTKSAEMVIPAEERSSLLKVIKEAGEPGNFMTVVAASLNAAKVPEALEHSVEIAEHIGDVIGKQVGLSAVVAGTNNSIIMWNVSSPSLAQYQANREIIYQDPGFQSLVKRGDGLYNESIQTSTLWRSL